MDKVFVYTMYTLACGFALLAAGLAVAGFADWVRAVFFSPVLNPMPAWVRRGGRWWMGAVAVAAIVSTGIILGVRGCVG